MNISLELKTCCSIPRENILGPLLYFVYIANFPKTSLPNWSAINVRWENINVLFLGLNPILIAIGY